MAIKQIRTTKCAKVLSANVTAADLTQDRLCSENVTTTSAKAHAGPEYRFGNFSKQKVQDQAAVKQL